MFWKLVEKQVSYIKRTELTPCLLDFIMFSYCTRHAEQVISPPLIYTLRRFELPALSKKRTTW